VRLVPPLAPLPIDPLLPEVVRTLASSSALVLEAPPGAGKTTRVPRAMYDADRDDRREIVVLEPRRLAARLAAKRVADELGEELGATCGYQVRFEDVSSPKTRIRFVTEGVLTRRLLTDPELKNVRAVLLDELHERHLHGDVALALLRRLQRSARPDLRLVAMSATLETAPVAAFLDAPTLRAEGRRFDVAIEHLPAPDDRPLASLVASAVRALVKDGLDGDVLVFLPGAGEIRRARESCEAIAREADLLLVPLHGDLPPDEQDRAVRRASKRKVILSTNVAESSVTIDGVVAVVDGGLARVAAHAAWSGMPMLRVDKVSRASATQRAGRAGRTRPGRCLRLYTKADFDARPDHDAPEIRRLDLAQTRLELRAALGAELDALPWLEAPPEPSVRAADTLLARLGAVDTKGAVTATGRRMLAFPVHPRAARVVVEAESRGVGEEGAVIAAILGERDLRLAAKTRFDARASHDAATERSDVVALLDRFREAEASRFSDSSLRAIGLDPGATFAVDRARRQIGRIAKRSDSHRDERDEKPLLLSILAGYPDRVAKRKGASREIGIAGGGIAELSEQSVVRHEEWLVAVDAERRDRGGVVVRLASGIDADWLIDLFPDAIDEHDGFAFDPQRERVERVSRMTFDGLAMHDARTPADPGDAESEVTRVLADAALKAGGRAFAPEDAKGDRRESALDRWLARVRFASTCGGPSAPSDDDVRAALVAECAGKTTFAELRAVSFADVLRHALGPAGSAKVDALAPESVRLTATRSTRIHYDDGKPPWIESYLQDFFGCASTPKVGSGKVALVVHLLAPNKRAVQVTTDLEGFWDRHYPSIKKELARKYPRHRWPDDPRTAEPGGGAVRRR
jgi:ATP-dependent helicase HrpB